MEFFFQSLGVLVWLLIIGTVLVTVTLLVLFIAYFISESKK